MNCHPERSEGSVVRRKRQIPPFAVMTKSYEYLETATPGILPVILYSAPSGKIDV
jgi:hypothetical protein